MDSAFNLCPSVTVIFFLLFRLSHVDPEGTPALDPSHSTDPREHPSVTTDGPARPGLCTPRPRPLCSSHQQRPGCPAALKALDLGPRVSVLGCRPLQALAVDGARKWVPPSPSPVKGVPRPPLTSSADALSPLHGLAVVCSSALRGLARGSALRLLSDGGPRRRSNSTCLLRAVSPGGGEGTCHLLHSAPDKRGAL